MLIKIPAMIYQIIIGCLKNLITPMATSTIPKMMLNEMNICSDMGRPKSKS